MSATADEQTEQLPSNLKDALEEVKKLRRGIQRLEEKYNEEVEFEEEEEKINKAQWKEIESKIRKDPKFIKNKLINGELDVFDINGRNETILMLCADRGSYSLCQLCLNLGAEVNHECDEKLTAIDLARDSGYFHVEQLLLFASMDAAISTEVNEFASTINRQTGCNDNFITSISVKKHKKIVQDTMVDIMINLVTSKLAFSDDLLLLCWRFVSQNNSNVLSSKLWKSIQDTAKSIIEAKPKNEKDWHWLKTYLLPSTIWLVDLDPTQPIKGGDEEQDDDRKSIEDEEEEEEDENGDVKAKPKEIKRRKYLFYELLKVVAGKADAQVDELIGPMSELANESPSSWKELTEWDIDTTLEDACRQDRVPNGVIAAYSKEELSKKATASTTFNAINHYDYNEYLSQLVLTAHVVDDGFHQSVMDIFSINKENNMYYNEETGDTIRYMRGPVKLIERCKAKAEVDYRNEEFPTSAHVLDINRCALVFDKIDTMLKSLKLFQDKVRTFKSGTIIDIMRDKNGFIEYLKQPNYADIKLNVLIRGPDNGTKNVIGEMQFLLQTMMDFKHKAHALYSITRRQELFDGLGMILPNLLNLDKKLFVAASLGDMKVVFDLMVTSNKTPKQIMMESEEKENILMNMCLCGELKAVKKLKTYFFMTNNTRKIFIDSIFAPNTSNSTVMDFTINDGILQILQYLLSIKEVKNEIKRDENLIYSLISNAFNSTSSDNCSFVLATLPELGVTVDDIKPKYWINDYNKTGFKNLLLAAIDSGEAHQIEKLYSIINKDDELFINSFNATNDSNKNCVDLLSWCKIEVLQFINKNKKMKNAIISNDTFVYRLLMNVTGDWYDYAEQEQFIYNELLAMNDEKWKKYLYFTEKYDKTLDEEFMDGDDEDDEDDGGDDDGDDDDGDDDDDEKEEEDEEDGDAEEGDEEEKDIMFYYDRSLLFNAMQDGNQPVVDILTEILIQKNEKELIKFLKKKNKDDVNAFTNCIQSDQFDIAKGVFDQIKNKKAKKELVKIAEEIIEDEQQNSEIIEQIAELRDSI